MDYLKNMDRFHSRCNEALLRENFQNLLKSAKESVQEIEVKDLDLENTLFIDVREPDEILSGVIEAKRVLTIPRGKLEFMYQKIIDSVEDNSIVVCYCLKGARGLLAAKVLNDLGIDAKNLKGGIEEWVKNGGFIRNYLGVFKLI